MLAPVPHLMRKAAIETLKSTLRVLWSRVSALRNTHPDYLDHLKV